MAARAGTATLSGMDRSLTGEELRFLESLVRGDQDSPALGPTFDDLPGWFRRAVSEEAAWLELEAAV